MITLKGLNLTLYMKLKRAGFGIDESRTRIIDVEPATIDVELPHNLLLQYAGDTDAVLIYTRDRANLFTITANDVEYVEIK